MQHNYTCVYTFILYNEPVEFFNDSNVIKQRKRNNQVVHEYLYDIHDSWLL